MRDANTTGWLQPLLAILGLQITAAYLTRVIPTIAPVLAADLNWPETVIGYLAGLTTLGSIGFLLGGAPLIKKLGPIRVLQLGVVAAGAGLLVILIPHWSFAAAAAVVLGLGYGPSVPAGNDVLHRTAPPQHRSLIFSIKQAGVPLAGVMAGLTLPALTEAFGWRSAIVFSAAIVAVTVIAVQPARRAIDASRDPLYPAGLRAILSPTNLMRPLSTLRESDALIRLSWVGTCFAVAQGSWFAFLVTYAVSALGLSLGAAGLMFAAMQATGIGGRMLLGFVSDRLGSATLTLGIVAFASSATSLALVFADATWPFWLLIAIAGVGGVTVSSWNGVQLAEIARLAPRARVAEALAGSTIVIFVGYVVGPAFFAFLVGVTQSYQYGFLFVTLTTLVAVWPLRGLRPKK
jgi:MFS family permease